jgi:ribonuclease HI
MGLLRGLEAAKKAGADSIEVFSDSELIVKQINGKYRVKSENLKAAYNKCADLLSGFDDWNISHISREKNTSADRLANRAMDSRKNVTLGAKRRASSGTKVRIGA